MALDPADEIGIQSHHYLRISLALIVLALFTAIGVYLVAGGGQWLPSISAYYYTPAHNVFVAALIAASAALAALAGRGIETVFLDIAAVFAPLIALVPTGINADTLGKIFPKKAPALTGACDLNSNCIPVGYHAAIDNGIATYMIVVVAVVLVTIGIRVRHVRSHRDPEHPRRQFFEEFTAPVIALLAVAGIGLLAFVAPFNKGFPFNAPVEPSVHLLATILFFGMFTAVPVSNAIRWLSHKTDEKPYKAGYVIVYLVIPAVMIADIIVLLHFIGPHTTGSLVMICEATALALFAVFWVIQTIQRWSDPSAPYLRAAQVNGA